MLSLHTNNAALSAQSSITRTQTSLSTSMTRLSTGYRINSASDDAAGLQIASRLKSQSSGMAVAMRNTQNATSMLQTADGALSEANNILVRMKDLATQAADASANASDKTAMQSEYDALGSELTNILGNTSFGGQKLFNGQPSANQLSAATTAKNAAIAAATPLATAATTALTAYNTAATTYGTTPSAANATAMAAAKTAYDTAQAASDAAAASVIVTTKYEAAATAASAAPGGKFSNALSFQIGASGSETMNLDVTTGLNTLQNALGATSVNFNSFGAAMGVQGTELTGAGASTMIDTLSTAIDALGSMRSALGAAANRLDHVSNNLANVSSNTAAATGRIMDVDFATESSNMTSSQMLLQAGTAMLKQSNSMSSMVMSLLQ
jgi:flagellin